MIRRGLRYIKRRLVSMMSRPLYPIDPEEIISKLKSAGISSGDHLLVHSSFKRFYQGSIYPTKRVNSIDYGQSLIDMFFSLTGPSGTLAFPTEFIGDYTHAMLSRQVFDLSNAPSNRGFLTDLFLKQQGVIRSTGPIYNIAMHGKAYERSLRNHWDYSYAMEEGTPWHMFTMNDGKIIFFGVSVENNSLIHLPEYILGNAYPRPVFFQRPHVFRLTAADGETRDVESYVHAITWTAGTVPRFCTYLNEKYGIYTTVKVHGAPIIVMSAKKLYTSLMSELDSGVSWYDAMVW